MRDCEQIHGFLETLLDSGDVDKRILSFGGKLALENKSYEYAERIYSSLLEQGIHQEYLLGLSQALFHQGRYKESEECLQELLEHIPGPCRILFLAYKNLGCVAMKLKNYEMAEEYYNKAHTLDPNSLSLKFQRAFMLLKQKEYCQAEKLFQEFLKVKPERVDAWVGLAIARDGEGELELAKASLHRSFDLDPLNPLAKSLQKRWDLRDSQCYEKKIFPFSA